MAAGSAVTVRRGRQQFGALFTEMFQVKCVMDPASLIDAAGETNTVAVPGLALGDMVLGVCSSLDLQDITVTAYVQAADALEVRYQNEGANTVDLASNTLKFLIGRPAWA